MKAYFYDLVFQYVIDKAEDLTSSFQIGIFSSRVKAIRAIENCKNKTGFKDSDVNNFIVDKRAVIFDEPIACKTRIKLYRLTHEYSTKDDVDIWTDFGLFSSEKRAIDELNIQKRKKKYLPYQEGFIIESYIVDKDIEWQEGFLPY